MPRFRETSEAHYMPPSLQEQQYRTRLATLRLGERLVRDRRGVRSERVKLLRPPRRWRPFDERTRSLIARVRSQSFYLPVVPPGPQWCGPDAGPACLKAATAFEECALFRQLDQCALGAIEPHS